MRNILNFISNTDGATAIEYGLIASLVAVAIVAALTLLGGGLNNVITSVTTSL